MIFFFFFEVGAFRIVVLKIIGFSASKKYFIYFTTSIYNTPSISFFFLITLFKII